MKRLFYLLIFSLITSLLIYPQKLKDFPPAGGGEYKLGNSDQMSKAKQDSIQEVINRNIKKLEEKGIIKRTDKPAAITKFSFPLKALTQYPGPFLHGISNFVDHNNNYPNQLRDYNNGKRTYDLSGGYNHAGTDMFTFPFSWYNMTRDMFYITAAAPGIIVDKSDSNYDRNCDFNNGDWNAVYIRHEDGTVLWYGHMKKNSLTAKNIGDAVVEGEYLGVVGSSGSSTGPHLHFELHNSSGAVIDPYKGPANPIDTSRWHQQVPYFHSKLNAIYTHGSAPVILPCPLDEIPNFKNQFLRGDTLFLAAYYHDQMKGQVSHLSVYGPTNDLFLDWEFASADSFYSGSYWYWYIQISSQAPFGNYRFVARYQGDSVTHNFTIASVLDAEEVHSGLEYGLQQNYPNPFNPNTTIRYNIKTRGMVELAIYDLLGNRIKELVNEEKDAGEYRIDLNASGFPSGVYFYRLRTAGYTETKKLVLLK